MNKERLLELAEFLEGLPNKEFNFSSYVGDQDEKNLCGTVCCAIGWMPRISKEWRWVKDQWGDLYPVHGERFLPQSSGEAWFDLEDKEYEHLFIPLSQKPRLGSRKLGYTARPTTVAANIREFIERKEAMAQATTPVPTTTPVIVESEEK